MILVAGFVSWDPNLILSAAFTLENLGMDFFWRRFRTCWMQTYFCFNKMINGKMAPSKSHHQVFARTLTQDLKATDLRPSAQHTLAVLGHGRPCSQKHFTWGHPENCSKTSDLHLSLFVSLQKKTISFYCIICHLILLFHVVSTFLTKHCKSCHNALAVVSNMQRMPKISPLFPAAKAGQVQIHFADLQTLATMLLSHRNAVHPLT